jgi:hypothetical protein
LKENLKEAIQMIIESNTSHYLEYADNYFEEEIAISI